MASVSIEIPDEKILEHLKETRRLVVGDVVARPGVHVESPPGTANTSPLHYVVVSATYALSPEEVDALYRS